ncbi:MAG: alpha-2-macroglobulin family protein [Armatimonadota bacterium]
MRTLRNRFIALALAILASALVTSLLLSAETPHGRVAGTLKAADTGARLARVTVSLAPAIDGASRYRTSETRTDAQGNFTFRHVPVGSYRLIAKTYAHEQPDQVLAVHEGQTTEASFELQPVAPFLRIFQNQQVFTTAEKPRLRCRGFVPVNELTVSVYRVDPKVAAARWHGRLTESLTLHGRDLERADLDNVTELSRVSRRSQQIGGRDVEGIFRDDISLGVLSPGMYLASIDADGLRELALVTVTDLGMIVKAAPDRTLIYATNIATGKPARARIEVQREGKTLASGETGADGLLLLPFKRAQEEGGLTVIGRAGDSLAVATLYPYWSREDDPLRVYTYTDRPVYRPGQTVNFRSVLRELHGDNYRVPGRTEAQVRVADGNDNTVYNGQHATTKFGSLSGEFDLSSEALPGSYTITVSADGGRHEAYFSVAEYRKPEFEITVTPAQKRYTVGQTIQATVSAQYYFGAPVPEAEVEYFVSRAQTWYYDDGGSAWDEDLLESESDYYDEGEIVAQGTGKMDENGRLTITIPPPKKEKSSYDEGQDWRYSIYVSVTDASRRSGDGQGSVLMTQGDYRLSVSPEDWVAQPDQQVAVKVRAIDYDGRPVAGASGELQLVRAVWQGERERRTVVERRPWKADDQGEATVQVTPREDGDFRLLARSTDGHRNRISGMSWLWVMSGEYSTFNYPYQDLDVRADRKLYRQGETAELIVNTRYAPQTALLTIESSRLLQQRLVRLEGKSTIIKIPVDASFLPSVHAGVCFFDGKRLVSGDALINVSREQKALTVEVTPDKQKYGPGEKATYRVRTLTPAGKPVQAEVSLGLVDEAIYGIARESAPNIVAYFYPKREHEVLTAFSFPEVYLSGDDKAGSTIRTRKVFRDTAFWNPATVTDANGAASFTITLPDNLTTWRATARAADLQTRVGETTSKVVVSKPFLLRLETPRFLTQGDKVSLTVVAHNLTDNPVTAEIGLDASGITLPKRPRGDLRIAPGKAGRLEWEASAPALGEARVRAWGKAGELEDAMELPLPVQPKGREHAVQSSGSVEGHEDLRFTVRKDVLPGTQQLTIRLTPTLVSAMLGSLDYLAAYPYGCTEQTMSAFLPDVVLAQLLKSTGIENARLKKTLPQMVEAGLLRLYGYQHDDGGWGWWKYDDSDPWMTAYVIYGMLQAKEAGFTVSPGAFQNGMEALKRLASSSAPAPEVRIYMAYVLALAGQNQSADAIVKRYTGTQGGYRREELSDYGRIFLARSLRLLGSPDEGRKVLETAWSRYTARQQDVTGDIWWNENDTAAALLDAACELAPEDPRLPDLVRGIVERRQGNHWYSTRDTAAVLYALTHYLQIIRELTPNLTATVSVNGHNVATRRFTAADVFSPEVTLKLGAKEIGQGNVAVAIETSGSGRLYYTANLEEVVTGDLDKPVRAAPGLVIERSYRKWMRAPGKEPAKEQGAEGGGVSYRSGEVVEVTLTVRVQRPFNYLMVEDRLPAGGEAQDRGFVSPWEWTDWWAEQVVRDRTVSFAIRHLNPGVHRLTYQFTAIQPGRFTALPPQVYDMYRPQVRAEGVANTVTIKP